MVSSLACLEIMMLAVDRSRAPPPLSSGLWLSARDTAGENV